MKIRLIAGAAAVSAVLTLGVSGVALADDTTSGSTGSTTTTTPVPPPPHPVTCGWGTHRVGDHCVPNSRPGLPGHVGHWNGGSWDFIHNQWVGGVWVDDPRDNVTIVDGDNSSTCVTYRNDAIRFANDLNRVRGDWRALDARLVSVHHDWATHRSLSVLSVSERADWVRLRDLENARLLAWNRSWGQLHTVCHVSAPPVTIVNNVVPAAVVRDTGPSVSYVDPGSSASPSGSSSGGGQVSIVPKGSAETGIG